MPSGILGRSPHDDRTLTSSGSRTDSVLGSMIAYTVSSGMSLAACTCATSPSLVLASDVPPKQECSLGTNRGWGDFNHRFNLHFESPARSVIGAMYFLFVSARIEGCFAETSDALIVF